jgi:hypothetical protein
MFDGNQCGGKPAGRAPPRGKVLVFLHTFCARELSTPDNF